VSESFPKIQDLRQVRQSRSLDTKNTERDLRIHFIRDSGDSPELAMVESVLTGWDAVSELLVAAGPLIADAEADARSLLNLSSKALAPLEDPLSTDFREHRWLKLNREEAYSDWFAWILDELSSVRTTCEILGITFPAETCDGDGVFVVDREVQISSGHPDRGGRLDILLTRTGACLAIVEIKIISADAPDADLAKHRGYILWHEQEEPFPLKPRVIISTSGRKADYNGFTHRGWREICIALRRLVPELITEGRCLLAALILCFCGAVEENLLGLEVIAGRIDRPASRAGCIETSEYLAETMNLIVRGNSNPDSIRKQERFMDTGLRCYPQAMSALRDFRQLVLDSSRQILSGRLSALETAVGKPIDPDIQIHLNPDSVTVSQQDFNGRSAWIAVKIGLSEIGIGHFGLIWGGPALIEATDYRAVGMIRPFGKRREEIVLVAKSLSDPVERWFDSELSLTTKLNSADSVFDSAGGPSVFEARLSDLIDRWVNILTAVRKLRSATLNL
jgi:hypothetical protein